MAARIPGVAPGHRRLPTVSLPASGCCCPSVFTNRVEDMRLQDLAEMDVKEMVQQVGSCCSMPSAFGDAATLLICVPARAGSMSH